MIRTYNPILDHADVPQRWFGSLVTAPTLGTAVVVVPKSGEPVVVWHGQHPPATRIGEHRRYVVDIANHGISLEVRTASVNPALPFTIAVEMTCRVTNPFTIAHDNIQDMTAALMPSLAREIRDTAAMFDALRPTEAARAIELRLGSTQPFGGVELAGYSVTVQPENTQGFVEAKQELVVRQLRRELMMEVKQDSYEAQIAQLLATNNGDIREVLDYITNERNRDDAVKLKALEIAMAGNLEDMDVANVQRSAFSSIFVSHDTKHETMRERLERRSKGAIEDPQEPPEVVESLGQHDSTDPAAPGNQGQQFSPAVASHYTPIQPASPRSGPSSGDWPQTRFSGEGHTGSESPATGVVRAVEPVSIYTAADNGEELRDAFVAVLEVCGFEINGAENPQRGSWFQRLFASRGEATAVKKLVDVLQKVERAAELKHIAAPRSESDERKPTQSRGSPRRSATTTRLSCNSAQCCS